MPLLELLTSDPSYLALLEAGDVGELLELVNAPSVEHRDATKFGPGGLLQRLPLEVVEAAALSFEAAAKGSAIKRLLTNTFAVDGFDFSNELVRANIDVLVEGGMSKEVGEALKGLGVWYTSPAFEAQGSDATKEQVVEAGEQLAQQRKDEEARLARAEVYRYAGERYNAGVAFLDANPEATQGDWRKFMAAE